MWLALLILTVGGGSSATAAIPTEEWTCDDPVWEGEPGSNDGIFSSALKMNCSTLLSPEDSSQPLDYLRERVQALIRKRTQHAEPTPDFRDGATLTRYETSHTVTDDGSPIEIRELVWLGPGGPETLRYETQSTQIQAKGLAGYLRSVRFSALLKVDRPGSEGASRARVMAELHNAIQVERPWYALDLIFSPIAKKTSRDKFLRLRETLLPLLTRTALAPADQALASPR